jgi:hypothetical protein
VGLEVKSKPSKSSEGHVYVLVSDACEYIKIGGTDYAPLKRIREINLSEPYKSLGPWRLHDFRQVADWRSIESALHYTFRSNLIISIERQKELFSVSPVSASKRLDLIDEAQVLKKPKIDRMFQDAEFSAFLGKFFRFTTILNWLELQGAWTFSLFPGTGGGRFYTMNIGPHEVAFATVSSRERRTIHMIHMDRLVYELEEVKVWVSNNNGSFSDDSYKNNLPRSTSVFFEGDFNAALEFLRLPGVRRAIIAYWTEALVELQEKGSLSTYSKHHNWNAVAEIKKRVSSNSI